MKNDYTYSKFFKLLLSGNYTKLFLLIFFQFISGTCPLLTAYFMSQLIDTISIIKNGGDSVNNFGIDHASILIIACILFLLIDDIFSVVHGFFCDYFEDKLCHKVKILLLRKISFYPTNEFFENPKISDLITFSQQNIQEFGRYINNFSHFFKGIFLLIPALIAVFTFKWWLALVIIMTLTPLMYFRVELQKKAVNIRVNFSSIFKKMNIYEECLTSSNYSKEIRLYHMQPKILTSWNNSYIQYLNKMNKFRKSGVFVTFLFSIFSGGGVTICFLYVSNNAIMGNFSLGSLSFLFMIILQLRSSIAGVIFSGTELLKANLSISPLLTLLNIKEPILNEKSYKKGKSTSDNILTFQNVTFSYSGNESSVLDNISLCIKKGESVAIVGENGAGKSTLIKLICRFYEPTNGKILWKNRNITSIEFEEYRSQISALFQDFAQFPLSVRENIDLRKQNTTDKKIITILDSVELKNLLADKLENILSKLEEGGIELSGGQWQRLGLARILVDLASNPSLELLVFDEPTSALDPHSEHHAIELIRQMIKQKTSIVISHRLALTRFVDRILVMENGCIVEDGSHSELMPLKGKYYQMFTKQASYYQDDESDLQLKIG